MTLSLALAQERAGRRLTNVTILWAQSELRKLVPAPPLHVVLSKVIPDADKISGEI